MAFECGYSLSNDSHEWFDDFDIFLDYLYCCGIAKVGTKYYIGTLEPVKAMEYIQVERIVSVILDLLNERASEDIDYDDDIFSVTSDGAEILSMFLKDWVNRYVYPNCMVYSDIKECFIEQDDLEMVKKWIIQT